MHLAIWWSNGYWFIGPHSSIGQTIGYARYKTEDYCPNLFNGKHWALEETLSITCKKMQLGNY